jgi:hypothetical protein
VIDYLVDFGNYLLQRFDRFNDLFERLVEALEKAFE